MRAPFPYFGSKRRVSAEIWRRLGSVECYVEPFAGSLAALLARPGWSRDVSWRETVNDLDGLLTNAWRSIKLRPEQVAQACNWPINDLDLHARHRWLGERAEGVEQLLADPEWCDPKAAGWWLWGAGIWVSTQWGRGEWACHPQIPGWCQGRGVHSARIREDLMGVMERLSERLRCVRIVCRDWERVLRPTVLNAGRTGTTGVLLDPPYDRSTGRHPRLYRREFHDTSAVRAWALERSDQSRLRIALCGLEGEHDELIEHGWTLHRWRSSKGSSSTHDEAIWFSPSCASARQRSLWAVGEVA